MESRRDFVQGAALVGGAAWVAGGAAAQPTAKARYADKLTDDAGKYLAAPPPYPFDALEPVIDARTVELHYTFHHKPAVTAANNAEAALAKARDTNDFALVKHFERELAFQLSSHILHSIYWTNLGGKGGEPKGELATALGAEFGSFARLKAQLAAATTAVEASGWGILGYHPMSRKLMVLQCETHQKLTAWGLTPVLVLDVFEHAYYLKYQNRRGEYVNGLFDIIDWDTVAARFDAARS